MRLIQQRDLFNYSFWPDKTVDILSCLALFLSLSLELNWYETTTVWMTRKIGKMWISGIIDTKDVDTYSV